MKDKIWLLALLLIPFVFILIVGIGYLQKETKPLETYSKSGEIKEFYNLLKKNQDIQTHRLLPPEEYQQHSQLQRSAY